MPDGEKSATSFVERRRAPAKRRLAGFIRDRSAEFLAVFTDGLSAVPLFIDIIRTKYSSSSDWLVRHCSQHGTVTKLGRGLANSPLGGTWSLVVPLRSPQYVQIRFRR